MLISLKPHAKPALSKTFPLPKVSGCNPLCKEENNWNFSSKPSRHLTA